MRNASLKLLIKNETSAELVRVSIPSPNQLTAQRNFLRVCMSYKVCRSLRAAEDAYTRSRTEFALIDSISSKGGTIINNPPPAGSVSISRSELATRWSCSQETLKRREKAGLLRAWKNGRLVRYRMEDVLQLEAQGRIAQ